MSKTVEKGAGGLEDDLVAKQREIIDLKAELEESRASNKRFSNQISKLKAKGGGIESLPADEGGIKTPETQTSATESVPKRTSATELPPVEDAITHFIKPYDKYCTTCGDKNIDFKDETECDGCGKHLGPVSMLPKIAACPECGAKTAHKIPEKTI